MDIAYTADDFAAEKDVSRETLTDFAAWQALLVKWNRTINLVSPSALDGFWLRHALDSVENRGYVQRMQQPNRGRDDCHNATLIAAWLQIF